jgi:preprotein translocase subunit SecE
MSGFPAITSNRKARTVTDEITPAASASRGDRKPNFFGRIPQFLREVIIELRKVVTPTRKELITYTSVVLGFVVFMMAIIGVLDVAIGILTGFVFGNGTLSLPWGN